MNDITYEDRSEITLTSNKSQDKIKLSLPNSQEEFKGKFRLKAVSEPEGNGTDSDDLKVKTFNKNYTLEVEELDLTIKSKVVIEDMSQILLEVTLDESGNLQEEIMYTYTSQAATYEGPASLVMSLSGLSSASFAEVNDNSDGSFTLKLNRMKVTESGSFTLTAQYGDSLNPKIESASLEIKVEFTDKRTTEAITEVEE